MKSLTKAFVILLALASGPAGAVVTNPVTPSASTPLNLSGSSVKGVLPASKGGMVPQLKQVGQRCGAEGQQGTIGGYSVGNYATFHQRMYFPYGARKLQLVYPNFFLPSGTENVTTPSMYSATGVTYTGGTGYAAGDVDTFAVTTATGIRAVTVVIDTVSGGVPVYVHVLDPGLYNTPLAAGVSPAATGNFTGGAGAGTGATATFTWTAGVGGITIGIEPVWNTLALSGANAVVAAGKGFMPGAGISKRYTAMLMPYGDFLITDPIDVNIPAGTYIGIRSSMGYNTPKLGRLPISTTYASGAPVGNKEAAFGQTTWADFSVNGTIGTSFTVGMLQPILALGIPVVDGPAIGALGDSRLVGVSSGTGSISGSDAMDNDGNIGWFEKAASAIGIGTYVVPWTNMSRQGDKLQNMVASFSGYGGENRFKAIMMGNFTAVYNGLNVNDLCGGTSLATLKTYEQEVYERLKGMGVKYVFTDTTDPETTSTDSWATTGNQTQAACDANIIARNDALAAGTWVAYDFYIDNRSIVESAVDSGLWVAPGGTGDGVHASPAINNLKAAHAATVMKANIVYP